jgi:hypothetical protein
MVINEEDELIHGPLYGTGEAIKSCVSQVSGHGKFGQTRTAKQDFIIRKGSGKNIVRKAKSSKTNATAALYS